MPKGEVNKEVKNYQELVCSSLARFFGANNVEKEWNSAKDSHDDYTRELYSPRLDIAVRPFNTDGNIDYNNEKIDRNINVHRDFLKKLWRNSELRVGSFHNFIRDKNKNPRCLLAIEIENSGSSKHMLGNVANVSILGSIGIVIPFNDEKLSLCKRIKKYVIFATEVEKIKAVFKNVLIIKKENFLRTINGNGR